MSLLNVLIIGCGNIAGGFDDGHATDDPPLTHVGAYQEHGGFCVTACVEPEKVRREKFMTRWKIPNGHPHIAMLADSMRFDVISVCSPTHLHASHLETALRMRPSLVFCEKPVTPRLQETRDWVRHFHDAGIPLAVNHNRRWAPDIVDLRTQLMQGECGVLRSVTGHYNKGILNNGSHMVDLIQFLCGPLSLLSAGAPVHDAWLDDPTVPALLHCNGVPVQLCVGDARDYALFELDIVTSAGMISMHDGGARWSRRRAIENPKFKNYKGLSQPVYTVGRYGETMRLAIANIHAAVREGLALPSTGATALAAQQVCDDIRMAALDIPK